MDDSRGKIVESDDGRRDPHAVLLERHCVRGLRSDPTSEVRGFLKNDQKNVFLITKSAQKKSVYKVKRECVYARVLERMDE